MPSEKKSAQVAQNLKAHRGNFIVDSPAAGVASLPETPIERCTIGRRRSTDPLTGCRQKECKSNRDLVTYVQEREVL